jgi:hypothetical protein
VTEPCKHREQHPEGTILPDDVSLEHFDQCFTPERRAEAWRWMRERSERGSYCLMADHEGALVELLHCHIRIAELSHDLTRQPGRSAMRTTYRARARRRTRSNR